MKSFLRFWLLAYLTAFPELLPTQEAMPQPLYTLDLSRFISQELDINPAGTLTFLTEKSLAVSICRNLRCGLETFDLASGKPRIIAARTYVFPRFSALFPAGGRVILNNAPGVSERGAMILDSHLKAPLRMAEAAGIREWDISTTGGTFVNQGRSGWVAYKTGAPPQQILAGAGRVLCISDDAVAYLDNGMVHIEGMDGRSLGSFAISPISPPTLRFLGPDHLWSQSRSGAQILDLNGKQIQALDKPDGWGFRIGQSADGMRILYDRYTRHISPAQKAEESAIAARTGVGIDEKPNGEMILVIDTRSGGKCFEWTSQANLLVPGQYHADIDPSGRTIAIMTPTVLNIYRLQESCGSK